MTDQSREEVAQYDFQGNAIRIVSEQDGTTLFCGKDVAVALGYKRPNDALQQHCKGAAIHRPLETAGGIQQARFITEGDLYRLIANSKLPDAEKFERWVFDEVLPSIRKHGDFEEFGPIAFETRKGKPLPQGGFAKATNLPAAAQSAVSSFEATKKIADDGSEYWSARDLMPLMGYARWEDFLKITRRAEVSASNTGQSGFSEITEKLSDGGRPRLDYHLSRFAAYLVAMNGDPNKHEVAAAQAYFAVRTRQAEKIQEAFQLPGNYVEALEALLASEKQKIALETRNQELTPKANAWQVFCGSSGDMSVADAAKALASRAGLHIGRNRLFDMMQDRGWLTHCHGYWEPLQYAVERGYLAVRVNMPRWKPNGESFIPHPTVRVTPKGLDRLAVSLPALCVGGEVVA